MKYRHHPFHMSRQPFFEGVYFKSTDIESGDVLAVIAGYSHTAKDPHSFIQFFNESRDCYLYKRYPLEDFSFFPQRLEFSIGSNIFTNEMISFQFEQDGQRIFFESSWLEGKAWPYTPFSQGAMGPFAFLPLMECYYDIINFGSRGHCTLIYNDKISRWKKTQVYIEKNWGKSFPSDWIWIQSADINNSYQFVCSIARIPYLGTSFTGVVCALVIDDQFYSFSTYNHGKVVDLVKDQDDLFIVLENPTLRLEIETTFKDSYALKAPTRSSGMEGICRETLHAPLKLILTEKSSGKPLWKGGSIYTACEFNGKIERLGGRNNE